MKQEMRDKLAIIYVEKRFTSGMDASMLLKLYNEAIKELKSESRNYRWEWGED